MKKKFKTLSAWSFVLVLVIFVLTYYVYHYVTPEGVFTLVYREEAGKPFVTQMLADLGVLFLFSGIINLLIVKIFCSDNR